MRTVWVILLLCAPTVVAAGERVAFFGLTLLDASIQTEARGEHDAELARLALLEEMVRDRFEAEGYELVDLEPARDQIERHANLAKCYGCDTRIAAKLGADFALVGEVQKVSNLILTINLQLRDAETGDLVRGGVVDIRGNDDTSWMRGMRYILKNRIFREES